MASVRKVGTSGRSSVDGLLSDYRWAGGKVTWSTPNSLSDYPRSIADELEAVTPINSDQRRAVNFALEAKGSDRGFAVEGFTKLDVSYIGGGSGKGVIRIVNSYDAVDTAGAMLPSTKSEGGDTFFGSSGRDPSPGNYDWATVLHELGHALGLKHPHESDGLGKMPTSLDSLEYSLMSYKSVPGTAIGYENEEWGYPQTYMRGDIAALQHLYGANYEVNSGNTTYSWSPTTGTTYVNGKAAITPGDNRIFMTIWDGGGRDTFDLSDYVSGVNIDLQPGAGSTFSGVQIAQLDTWMESSANVWTAFLHKNNGASLIENAIGGSGADTISGNRAANTLRGNDGSDTLIGKAGNDKLYGGAGYDTLKGFTGNDFLSGGGDSDYLYGGSGNDTLQGGLGWDHLTGGPGNDVFRFHSGSSVGSYLRDVVRDFTGAGKAGGDVIDVSPMDANVLVPGNQTFKWGGWTNDQYIKPEGTPEAITDVGYLWVAEYYGSILVRVNTGDYSDFQIDIETTDGAVAADFTARDFLL